MLQDYQTALYLAACNGYVVTVTLLLEKGADFNICDKVLEILYKGGHYLLPEMCRK